MPFFNFIETLSVLWWKKFEDELEHIQHSVGNANCWCNQGLRGYINMCLTICQHDPLYHTPPPSGKELLFSLEADKPEVSNDSTWAREDVQDSISWDGPFPLHLPPPTSESLHHALLQSMVGWLWLSSPTHIHISHLASTQGGLLSRWC